MDEWAGYPEYDKFKLSTAIELPHKRNFNKGTSLVKTAIYCLCTDC